MYQTLSFHDFLNLAQSHPRVAIYQEIPADRLTFVGIIENLKYEMQDGMILESSLHHQSSGRYSYISFGSIAQLNADSSIPSPFKHLRHLMQEFTCTSNHPQVNFINGAMGFITYDAIRLFEAIPDRHANDTDLPDILFNIYQTNLMFDHIEQKLLISMNVEVKSNPPQIYHETHDKIRELITQISQNNISAADPEKKSSTIDISEEADISDDDFIQLVEQAKNYIQQGDAFQIVLSRCFKKPYSVSPFAIYRTLRRVNPAPYMFYLPYKDMVIVGASPEKLISVRNREVEINPIAGTRLRTTLSDDKAIENDLLNDKKELAEHVMLVDLARNDLGAVCVPGSIEIKSLKQIKHYSHISHITSEITGLLAEDKDVFDALASTFPAGTLSGAPKVRAMEIIDALETSRRGIYGGAICRLDFQGNLDSCIAIRMAILRNGIATVRTGAGIVHDSDPMTEANETRHKAKGILSAISLAEEMSA